MTNKATPKALGFGPQGTVYKVSSPTPLADLGAKNLNGVKVSQNDQIAAINVVDASSEKPTERKRKKPYQPVRFAAHIPLEGYYNDGHGNLYNVARLVDMCKDLEPFDAPLQAFDLSAPIWQNYSIFDLAFHVKAVNDADLDYPIILDWNGSIADGRHRIIKALVLGHSTIKCVRMYWKPEADKQI